MLHGAVLFLWGRGEIGFLFPAGATVQLPASKTMNHERPAKKMCEKDEPIKTEAELIPAARALGWLIMRVLFC
jgi:hypothetical protein